MPRDEFVRDAGHWLYRYSGDEWIGAAIAELRRAEAAVASRNASALVAAAKRAAGMALNGALVVRPDARWGRSYVEHLVALADDASTPGEARDAARRLRSLRAAGGPGHQPAHSVRRCAARGGRPHRDGSRLRDRLRFHGQGRGCMRVVIALAGVCMACGASSPPPPGASPPAPPPTYAPPPQAAMPPAAPPMCAPGGTPAPAGGCAPPALPTASASAPPPAPPPPKPGTVPGGLARGTGDAADKALLVGDKAFDLDDLPAAKRAYDQARRLAPKDPAPRVGQARVALAVTGVATDYAAAPKDRRVAAVLRQLDAALALDKDYGPAYVERGRVLLILGRAPDALAALGKGVELMPRDAEAHSALAVAQLATGKSAEALDHFKRAADLDPDNADRLTNLGTAYMMRGRVDDALRAYQRAVQLAPDDARVHGDLGTAYLAANKAQEALEHLKKAVQLAPDRATFLSNLGYAYQLLGKLDDAVATCRLAIKKDPKLGSAWINLGTALAKQKKFDEAEKAFKQALALDPTDPRAKANLDELAAAKKAATPAK